MDAPSPDNYTLGKGVVYFNLKDATTGLYHGERDLGNAPAFSYTLAIEKLAHYSSRGGLRAKDKEVVSELTPTCTFSLDEINPENMALQSMSEIEEVTQVAGNVVAEEHVAHLGRRFQVSKRHIGNYMMTINTQSGAFTVDEVLTGAGGATATLLVDSATSIIIRPLTGTFVLDETITGGTSAETAVVEALPVFQLGYATVTDTTEVTTYVAGTDYSIDNTLKDGKIGRILPLTTGSIVEGETLKVSFDYDDLAYKILHAFNVTEQEGALRFVSDNPVGDDRELIIWRCSLTASGDISMIGEDWAVLGFTGEILKDEVNHPTTPYMDIIDEN